MIMESFQGGWGGVTVASMLRSDLGMIIVIGEV